MKYFCIQINSRLDGYRMHGSVAAVASRQRLGTRTGSPSDTALHDGSAIGTAHTGSYKSGMLTV